jgi:hypothetical protein
MADENSNRPPEEPTTPTEDPKVSPNYTGVQPPPSWEYRKNFKVTDRMIEIVSLTIDASRAEIRRLRRKVEKLQYGA